LLWVVINHHCVLFMRRIGLTMGSNGWDPTDILD
jgi:hypothetical protein